MTHHNMLAAVLDFLQVRNFLEHTLCGSAELLGIVIAPYQHLVAAKRTNNRRPLAFLCPDEIAKNVYRVIAAYSGVPILYELVIHLIDIRKWPVIKPQNIFMPDMQIRNIVIHCVPFCCVFECHKKPPYSCDGHNNTEASLFFQICNMVSYSSSSSSFGQDEIM